MPDTAYLEKGEEQRRYTPEIGAPIDQRKLDQTKYHPVEWAIVNTPGTVLVERSGNVRQYHRQLARTGLISLVFDGKVDEATAKYISGIAKGYTGGSLWVWYQHEGNGVRGFSPIEVAGFQKVKKPQIAFEMDSAGELEKRTINEIKEALLRAGQKSE